MVSKIALVLIDIQCDFWEPLKKYPNFRSFPDNIRMLLDKARTLNLPVIHLKSSFRSDRSDWMLFYRPHGRGNIPCIEGTRGTVIEDFATPIKDEILITKHTFDGFIDTNLGKILRDLEIEGILIAGLEMSVCILFTATSAYLRDLVPFVVTDACADEPLRHNTTIQMYRDLCFKTVTTSQVQENWEFIENLSKQFVK